MFIKRGDGKILSVVDEDCLEEEQKKLVKKVSENKKIEKEEINKKSNDSN